MSKHEKRKISNHEADIQNPNDGTSGKNKTIKKNQDNRSVQLKKQQKDKKQVVEIKTNNTLAKPAIQEVTDFTIEKKILYPKTGVPSKKRFKKSGKKRKTNVNPES